MLRMRFELLDGFEVLVAENGDTGCVKAIAEQPDLILMDLDLPVVDGWEATRRLKSNSATRDIPIIALTAHALSGSREKALAAGCDEFDTKPWISTAFCKRSIACSPAGAAPPDRSVIAPRPAGFPRE